VPKRLKFVVVLLFILTGSGRAQEQPELDLRSIPISDWLNSGEHGQIPWNFHIDAPHLRVDQRLEVLYEARINGKDLSRLGSAHELFFVSRVSTPDGEWLNEPHIDRNELQQLPKGTQFIFTMHLAVQPGDYVLWCVLYDRTTGKHNLARRPLRVAELRGDPLPDLYSRMPLIEFPENDGPQGNGPAFIRSPLYLPIHNKRPIQVDLISMLSPPEQWTGRSRLMRAHNDDTLGALAALSQMNLAEGSLSIAGLDLVRRQVMFEQRDFKSVEWETLMQAMKTAQSPNISAQALQGAKSNGAFFREFLNQRLTGENAAADGTHVIVVVTSSRLFESGSDLRPLQIEGDCNCRVYYLRFRLNVNDVFDQLDKFMKPLRPRIFNLITARDLRKAIADIVGELEKL
jgi:hypothetical protein